MRLDWFRDTMKRIRFGRDVETSAASPIELLSNRIIEDAFLQKATRIRIGMFAIDEQTHRQMATYELDKILEKQMKETENPDLAAQEEFEMVVLHVFYLLNDVWVLQLVLPTAARDGLFQRFRYMADVTNTIRYKRFSPNFDLTLTLHFEESANNEIACLSFISTA